MAKLAGSHPSLGEGEVEPPFRPLCGTQEFQFRRGIEQVVNIVAIAADN